MDKTTKCKLIQVLKSNKLLQKFEKAVELMRVKRDTYFDWAESIYAISRVITSVTDMETRMKMEAVNRIWVKMVIVDDECPQLRPYYEKYGQQAVYDAVEYLMEKNAWVSPADDKGLKAHMPSNYDGLKDIDETVAYLREEKEYKQGMKATESNGQQESKVAKDSQETTEATEPEKADSGLPIDAEALAGQKTAYADAMSAYTELGDMLARANELHAAFGNLTRQDELLTMFEQENKKLEKELAEQKNMLQAMKRMKDEEAERWRKTMDKMDAEYSKREEQYKKDIDTEKGTSETLRKELERERRLHKEDNDKAYHNRLAKEKAETELKELNKEMERKNADLAELRRLAREAKETPSFKVIPLEDLENLYGMGAKMKSVLLPFMEKFGVRFMDEDERRKMKRAQR